MNYIKMVFYWGFDLVGSFLNLLASLVGYYPKIDLGVKYLLYLEEKRIKKEKSMREVVRSDHEVEATALEAEALEVDG